MTRSSILFQRHRPAEIKLWDFPSGRLLQTLTNHQADLTALAFTPDDRLLASGSVDQTVRLWDFGEAGAWRAPSWTEIAAAGAKEKTENQQPCI